MISESHDTPTITYWLSLWLWSGAPAPNEIVCDYSNALIGAITRSFCGGMSKRQYCKQCLDILEKKELNLPEVYVRLDIAHFIKMTCRWKCLKKGPIKEFFVCSIILLIHCKTLKEFEDTHEKIVVVACSETDEPQHGSSLNDSPAERFRNDLIGCIEDRSKLYDKIIGKNPDEDDGNYCINSENVEDSENILAGQYASNMDDFLENLNIKINQFCEIKGTRINAFYLPKLKIQLNRIVKDFPMWSNVINQFYNSYFYSNRKLF